MLLLMLVVGLQLRITFIVGAVTNVVQIGGIFVRRWANTDTEETRLREAAVNIVLCRLNTAL